MSQAVSSGNALDEVDNPFSGGAGNNDLDKDAFLKLLITQFQHQDPLNPMDDKEFIAQLAQFSALEQSMAINEKMDTIVMATVQQTTVNITNYIGMEVSGFGYGLGVKDGFISKIQYAPDEEVAEMYVNILDSSKQIVATHDLGARGASIHEFEWDGKRTNGSMVPDGVYTAQFSGKNKAGQPVPVNMSITGKVVGTKHSNGEHYLTLSDGRSVPLAGVREVVESTPPVVEEVVPGKLVKGTNDDDYLVGGEGADEIKARGGDDIIVYDPLDELVDGGTGYDFLISKGTVGENAKKYEAVLRGTNAMDIKSISDLELLGLTFKTDATTGTKEIDTELEAWTNNWTNLGKGQWTYSNLDGSKKMTIEILSQADDPAPEDPLAPVTRSVAPTTRAARGGTEFSEASTGGRTQANKLSFSEALQNGMNKSIDDVAANTAKSLSNNAPDAINRFMKAMNG